jgi:hypothetical protein
MGQSQSFAKPPARNENRCAKQSAPSSVEIRLELDRIVVSAPLRDSLRLASFLRFVVEAALNGKLQFRRGFDRASPSGATATRARALLRKRWP